MREIKEPINFSGKDEKSLVSSCRFCTTGRGKYLVVDTEKKEKFWLCDKHLAEYNLTNDTIPGGKINGKNIN